MKTISSPLESIGDQVLSIDTWSPKNASPNDEFQYIDIASVDRESKRLTETTRISAVDAPSRARQIVRGGDVLVSTVRPNLNAVAMVPDDLSDAIASTGFCVLRCHPNKLDQNFLFHWVRTTRFVGDMVRKATGASYPAVSDRIIKESMIPLPPLSEQKRIADILDKADAIRRKRQEGRLDVQRLKTSAFLDLFGDPREPKSDWAMTSLEEVALLDAPMVDPRDDEYADMIHIGPDRIEKETGRLLPALTAREENLISKKFLFDQSYLLYSKIRPYLRKVALPDFKGLCSADMYPIRPVENKATREFLYALLISRAFVAYTETLPSRANIPKINRKELASYRFPLPDYELQVEYSNFMKGQASFSQKYSSVASETDDLFSSLVQRAFKGEL